MSDELCRKAVEIAERFCDGEASDADRLAAYKAVLAVHDEVIGYDPALTSAAVASGSALAHAMPWLVGYDLRQAATLAASGATKLTASPHEEAREQVALAHDIFGNPFRPVVFSPTWRTSDVIALAGGVYEDKAFDSLPILADALQDAGCDNDDILDHCRDPRIAHVRGCWVLDLILGRS